LAPPNIQIVDDAFDRSTQVQLVTKGIELSAEVNILQREGGLVDVEGMGTLVSGWFRLMMG